MKAVKIGLVLLVLVIASIAMAAANTNSNEAKGTTSLNNPSSPLIDPRDLTINWTTYNGFTEEYYMYENGRWIKKEKPIAW